MGREQRRVNHASDMGQTPGEQRQIALLDGVALELTDQRAPRLHCLGEEDDAGGLAVEPVQQPGTVLANLRLPREHGVP